MDLRIGCSVSYEEAYHYFDKVKVLELYDMPSEEEARELKEKAPKDLSFVIKTTLDVWEEAIEAARILESELIVFDLSAEDKEGSFLKRALDIFLSLQKKVPLAGWIPPQGALEAVVQELSEKADLIHSVDPFRSPSLYGGVGYFRMTQQRRYSGLDMKKLRDICENESDRFTGGKIYVIFDNPFRDNDATRFEWIAKNTGPIKEINRSLLSGLCSEIEIEEEDENVQKLSREAEKIVNLILHTEYEKVDIDIEAEKLRGMCKDLFPEKEYLYDMIYGKRFERLWEQFREGAKA